MISLPTTLLRLGVAIVLGALVGLERETREHPAGLRTQALIALGSSLFTIISAYGFTSFLGTAHVQIDPTRIASYIVAGIGFLGAGAIFMARDKERVKGLTTAASIWLVAAVGLACGAGLLLEAIAATALALIVLVLLRYVERLLLPRQFSSSSTQHLHIEATSVTGEFIGTLYDVCTRSNITIEKLGVRTEEGATIIAVACHVPDAATLAHVVGELHALPGVRAVHANLDSTHKDTPLSAI